MVTDSRDPLDRLVVPADEDPDADDEAPATSVANQHRFDDEESSIDAGENYHELDEGT